MKLTRHLVATGLKKLAIRLMKPVAGLGMSPASLDARHLSVACLPVAAFITHYTTARSRLRAVAADRRQQLAAIRSTSSNEPKSVDRYVDIKGLSS